MHCYMRHLDLTRALREAVGPMKPPLLTATAVALLALTACQSKTETNTVNNSTTENTTTAVTTPIELPPAIKTEGSYRCHGDNSLVKVTFFEAKKDGTMTAAIMSPPDASPVQLTGAAGQPMTADGGWALSGTDTSFKLTQPGKPEQSCSK
jgi:outer membrane biogenesis lipoprotein LolB